MKRQFDSMKQLEERAISSSRALLAKRDVSRLNTSQIEQRFAAASDLMVKRSAYSIPILRNHPQNHQIHAPGASFDDLLQRTSAKDYLLWAVKCLSMQHTLRKLGLSLSTAIGLKNSIMNQQIANS